MNAHRILGILLSSATLVLAACGTSTLGGGDGNGGHGNTGAGGGEPGLCDGEPSPVSCTAGSCPSGYSCITDYDDMKCHPSSCSCTGSGWVCTADCGTNGSTCVAWAEGTCKGAPSPVSCTTMACPAGFFCQPDPVPSTCHPSSCTCTAQGWTCDASCMQNGSSCVMPL